MPDHNAPLPQMNGVPIIGQPVKVVSFVPTLMMICGCAERTPMLVVGIGAIVECPTCRRRFTVQAIEWNAQTDSLNIEVGLVLAVDQRSN